MSISVAKNCRNVVLGRLEIEDLNRLLSFNKKLFLSRGEICEKTKNSFMYLKKVLEKRSFSFKSGELEIVQKLEKLMRSCGGIHAILERVEDEILQGIISQLRIEFSKRREILHLLRLSVYLEFCVFMMLESSPDFTKIIKKHAQLVQEKGGRTGTNRKKGRTRPNPTETDSNANAL